MTCRVFAAAFAALFALSGVAHAATELFFDDFNANTARPNTAPIGWSVSNGTVDIVGPGYHPEICAPGAIDCIDLDGSTGNAGRMTSVASFSLQAGATYTLSFDYIWNYFNQNFPNTMTYGVGGFSQTLTTNGSRPKKSVPYIPLTFSFVGDGSSGSIFFDHQGGDNGGIVVDNVRLVGDLGGGVTPPSPIPLPAGMPLILAGLGGLAALRLRRAKA